VFGLDLEGRAEGEQDNFNTMELSNKKHVDHVDGTLLAVSCHGISAYSSSHFSSIKFHPFLVDFLCCLNLSYGRLAVCCLPQDQETFAAKATWIRAGGIT